MPTIVDVAKRANVSISTVSYALSGTRPISDETKRRIFQAMDDLNYQPHALARGLASKRSRVVALHAPPLPGSMPPSELGFATGAADAARAGNYSLLLATFAFDDLDALRGLVQQGLVDGVILMEVVLADPRVALLMELGFPFVLIGRCKDNDGISYVDLDYDQAIGGAVQYLASLGHRRVDFICMSAALHAMGYGPAVRGPASFQNVLLNSGLEGKIMPCEPSAQAGYETTLGLLARQPRATALVIYNNRTIPGALQALQDRGLRVPEDFSLVALTALSIAEMSQSALAFMAMPSTEMGCRGTELLLQKLSGGGGEPTQMLVHARLVHGGFVAPRV